MGHFRQATPLSSHAGCQVARVVDLTVPSERAQSRALHITRAAVCNGLASHIALHHACSASVFLAVILRGRGSLQECGLLSAHQAVFAVPASRMIS